MIIGLTNFPQKTLEYRSYLVPNQISDPKSIRLLSKTSSSFKNVFSLFVWVSEDPDIYILSITRGDGITCLYNITNSYFSQDLSEFLTNKTKIFILWDTFIDSPLKKYFENSINVRINMPQYLTKIKTKNLTINPIFLNLDVTNVEEYLTNIFRISREKLDKMCKEDVFYFISFISISVFDTYCLIEQEILYLQNQYPNDLPKPFIWTDNEIKGIDIGVNTEPVQIVAMGVDIGIPANPPPRAPVAVINNRPPFQAINQYQGVPRGNIQPLMPPNWQQHQNHYQRRPFQARGQQQGAAGFIMHDIRARNIEERFATLIEEAVAGFHKRFKHHNSACWDPVYEGYFAECKERLLRQFAIPSGEICDKMNRLRHALDLRIKSKAKSKYN